MTQFQQLIWQKGKQLYRPMPWRERPTFYYVLVSEIMLQQTQVGRVLAKFTEFTRTFPTIDSLACWRRGRGWATIAGQSICTK